MAKNKTLCSVHRCSKPKVTDSNWHTRNLPWCDEHSCNEPKCERMSLDGILYCDRHVKGKKFYVVKNKAWSLYYSRNLNQENLKWVRTCPALYLLQTKLEAEKLVNKINKDLGTSKANLVITQIKV